MLTRRDPRASLTPGQRTLFDRFASDPSAAQADEISATVLRALENEYRPTSGAFSTSNDFLQRRAVPTGELLTAADAAQLLGVSMNTFGRSVERTVKPLVVDGRTVFRRADLLAWNEQRFAKRKRPPPAAR